MEIIRKGFNLGGEGEKGVGGGWGEGYIVDGMGVGGMGWVEMGLGCRCICCGVVEEVVEDSEYRVEDMETLFGGKIGEIVDGLRKM